MKLLRLALLATLLFSFHNAGAATLTESPANIAQNGTVTATWSAIAAPTVRDWIALSSPGALDTTYVDWIYVNSCTKSAGGSAVAAGSCPFVIPGWIPNGTNELRLFANNGYTRLATSNGFNVSPVPPPSLPLVDNGDGTVTDGQTGLMWEKKTACAGPSATDIHCVNNTYSWSISGTNPNGTLITDFLARINAELSTSADGITVADICFAGYCDWRLPNIVEARTILLAQYPCGTNPCIDPIFGPTAANLYWSSTTSPQVICGVCGSPPVISSPEGAWAVNFNDGKADHYDKISSPGFARAVRRAW